VKRPTLAWSVAVSLGSAFAHAGPKDKAQAPAFVVESKAACAKYQAAKNEIKASEHFTQYFEAARANRETLESVVGTLVELETTPGGDEVLLKVRTPFGTFGNNDALQEGFLGEAMYEIKKGSPVYRALSELEEGAKVRVSLDAIVPEKNPFSEKLSVCDGDWVARFVSVEPVK
jgi:hypothetical protein